MRSSSISKRGRFQQQPLPQHARGELHEIGVNTAWRHREAYVPTLGHPRWPRAQLAPGPQAHRLVTTPKLASHTDISLLAEAMNWLFGLNATLRRRPCGWPASAPK